MKLKYIILLSAGLIILGYVAYRVFLVREKVTFVTVKKGKLVSLIYATGKVNADDIAVLRCESGGNVNFLGVKEGASVKKGTLLLSSDKSEIALKINQADNEIKTADVELSDKKLNLSRLSNLVKSHTITIKEFDVAKKDYDLALITLERQRIMLKQEKENLTKLAVTAPFDCVVYNISVNLGDYLPPNTECFRVFAPGSIIVEAQVDEQDLAKIVLNQHSLVAFDAFPGQKFDAVVFRIVPQTDEATKTSKVFLKLNRYPPNLNIGMTATVNIIAEVKDDVLILPKTAIINKNNKLFVFQILDGRLHETEVTAGIMEGNYIELLTGVKQGMKVVSETKPSYVDNMRVTI